MSNDDQCKRFASAITQAAKNYENKTPSYYVKLALSLFQEDHVCPRCVLRLLGHSPSEDWWGIPQASELVAFLAEPQQSGPAPQGIGQKLTEDQFGAKKGAVGIRREHQQDGELAEGSGEAGEPSAKRRAVCTEQSNHGTQQQGALSVLAEHSSQQQQQQQQQQQEGSGSCSERVCPMCLGVLQQLAGSFQTTCGQVAPPPPPGAGLSAAKSATPCLVQDPVGQQQPMQAAAATPLPQQQQQHLQQQQGGVQGHPQQQQQQQQQQAVCALFAPQPLTWASPRSIAQAVSSQGLEFSSFGLELCIPAVTALREARLHAHLRSRFGHLGVMSPSHPDNITLLKNVMRQMLSKPLAQHLGKLCVDNSNCDVILWLKFDNPAAQEELRVLAEDQLRMQERKDQRGPRQPHKQQGKETGQGKQVGDKASEFDEAGGVVLGADGEQGTYRMAKTDVAKAGTAGSEQRACRAAQSAAAGTVEAEASAAAGSAAKRVDTLVAAMNADQVAARVNSLPKHLAAKLLVWPPTLATVSSCARLKLSRAPLLLAGRYLKLERNMPQTKWIDQTTGNRIGGVSLAERIESFVLPVFGADGSKFISGGREDADVRMMGEGRPFVMEIINPKAGSPSEEQLRRVERDLAAANNGVQVRNLQLCSKHALLKLKEAEESKEKTYQALCWCDRVLSDADVAKLVAVKDLEVMQDTPIRVLHRRASKIRPKYLSIETVNCLPGKPQYFNLRLRTQAGTYIKEFCHGDLGRSHPSLATLLGAARVEILQLDVAAVHMDNWP